MKELKIAGRTIGLNNRPFIIAEMSGNHNQSLDRALAIVDEAAGTGVDALKVQTFTADDLTIDVKTGAFFISDPESLWQGSSLHELYKKAHLPWEWHKKIFDRCQKHGLIYLSTPQSEAAVDFLEKLNTPCYKIASFENVHLPLIKKIASTGKPILISTGMTTLSELEDAMTTIRGAGGKDVVLLKCTSSYPATPENSNLLTIPHLRELFDCEVGLSDHTLGLGVAVAGVALGATVVEKHFTLSRADGGLDAAFSMEPAEMSALVKECKRAWQAKGKISYQPTEAEKRSMVFRRSLYITKDLKAGEKLSKHNLRIIRPGYGLAPKYYDDLLGKKVKRGVKRGTPVSWGMI